MKSIYKMSDIVLLALQSLMNHKVQSALTALGIIFGVWGVVAMLAINEGASLAAAEALRRLGTDNIIINSVKPPSGAGGAMVDDDDDTGMLQYGLTEADVARLVDNIPGVKQHVRIHLSQKKLHYRGKDRLVSVIATEPHYLQLARVRMQRGRFLRLADMTIRPRLKTICVITSRLAEELFTYRDPLGRQIRIQGKPFTIVGVMESLPPSITAQDVDGDYCVVVPWQTAMKMFGTYNIVYTQGSEQYEQVEISQLILRMAGETQVLQGRAVAENLLERFHQLPDYSIRVPLAQIRAQQEQRRFWNITLFGIAAISLVVGGIGIMNIMLASVTERTREIGIRRALGARRGDIVVQFLVEAVTLTTIGGVAGILLGMAAPRMTEDILGFKAVVAGWTLLLPFAMAILVGLISGLYPAMRAAKLDPIRALRHE
jgi:putative ABC transport system permease protein